MNKRILGVLLAALLGLTLLTPMAEANHLSLRFSGGCNKTECVTVRYVRDYTRTLLGKPDVTITGAYYSQTKPFGRNPKVYMGGKVDSPNGWLKKREWKYVRFEKKNGKTAWVRAGSYSTVCLTASNVLGKGMGTRVCVPTGQLN